MFEKTIINEKGARDGPFLKKNSFKTVPNIEPKLLSFIGRVDKGRETLLAVWLASHLKG